MESIVYQALGQDEIGRIRPLWDRLRLLTREMTTHFKQYYEELAFDVRMAKLARPGTRSRVEVARDGRDGPIMGYAIGSISADGVGEIDSFYVDERFRRRGIGARLLERITAWLNEQGVEQIVVFTAYENREVLALYERFGLYPRLIQLNRK